MSQEKNIGIARQLLAGLGEGKEPSVIATLFGEDVVFEIPGDTGVLPWIGRETGREAVADFIRGLRSMTEPVKFDVHEIMASDARAAIIGEMATRIKATGKVIESPFAIILTVSRRRGHALPDVGRQLRGFQCCEGLRGASRKQVTNRDQNELLPGHEFDFKIHAVCAIYFIISHLRAERFGTKYVQRREKLLLNY